MYKIYEKEQQLSKGQGAATQLHITRRNINGNDNNYPDEIIIRRWLKNEEQNRPLELLLYIQTKPVLFRPYSVYKNFIHDEHLFTTIDLPEPVMTTGMGVYFQQTHITGCNLDLLLYVVDRNEPLRANRYMPVEDGLMYLRLPSPFYIRKVKLRCTISAVLSINRIRVDLAGCTLPSKLLHQHTIEEEEKKNQHLESKSTLPPSEQRHQEEPEECEESEEKKQNKNKKQVKASTTTAANTNAKDAMLLDLTSPTGLLAPFAKTVVDVTEENVWNAILIFWKYYDATERKMKYLGSTLVDSRSVPRCCEMILAQMSGILPSVAQIQLEEMHVRRQKKHKPSPKKRKTNTNKNEDDDEGEASSDSNEEKDERKTGNKNKKKVRNSTSDNEEEQEEEEKEGKEDKSDSDDDNNNDNEDDDDEHSIDNDLRFHVANEMNDNWEFYEERNNTLTQCTNNTTMRFQDIKFISGSCLVVEYVGKLPAPTTTTTTITSLSSFFTNEEGSVVKYYKEVASMIKVFVTQIRRVVHDNHANVAHMMNIYYKHYTLQTNKVNNTLTNNTKLINNDINNNSTKSATKVNAPTTDTTSISSETNSLTDTTTTSTTNKTLSHVSNSDSKNVERCSAELHNTPNSACASVNMSSNTFSTTLPALHTREFNAIASNVCFMSKHLNYNSVCNKIALEFKVKAENILLYPCSSHIDDVDNNSSQLTSDKSSPTSGTVPGVVPSSINTTSTNNNYNNKGASINNAEDRFSSFVSPSDEAFSVSFTEMDNVLGTLVNYNHTFTHHNRLFFEVLPISRERYLQYAPLTVTLRDAAGHVLLKERFNIIEKMCSLSGVVHTVLQCAKREVHPRPVMSASEESSYTNNKKKRKGNHNNNKNNMDKCSTSESNELYDPWNSLQETLSSRHFLFLMTEPHAHVYRTLREVQYNPSLLPSLQNKQTTSHGNAAQSNYSGSGRPKEQQEHQSHKNNHNEEKEVNEHNNTSSNNNTSNAEEDVDREVLATKASASRAQSVNRETSDLDQLHDNKQSSLNNQDYIHNSNNNNSSDMNVANQTASFDHDIVLMSDDEDDEADSDNDSDDFESRESRYRDKVELQNFALQGFEFEVIPAEPLKPGEQRITCCQGEVISGHDVKIFGNPFFITINERTTVTDAMELMLQRTHCSPSLLVDNPKLKVMMYTNIGKHFNE